MVNPAGRPRVLLVEDNAVVRRFVGMALEGVDIELVECTCTADALKAFGDGAVRLVLTDLSLPGESGLTLLENLSQDPVLRGNARLAVFSATLDPALRQRLEALNVWRILPKPASLATLKACVLEALADGGGATAPPAKAREAPHHPAADEAGAIALHFEGNAQLYADFKAACLTQFPLDVRAGDQACDAGDGHSLQRVAHNLKTVLLALGCPALELNSHQIELHSAAGEIVAASRLWRLFRTDLLRLAGQQAHEPGSTARN